MGIYDREYYRDSNSYFDRLVPSGQVCKNLIILNIIVFLIQLITLGRNQNLGPFTDALILDPEAVLDGQVWRLLTYAFLHAPFNVWHIVFNLLFLWWFGSELEQMYGSREFLTFYLVAALLGGLAFFGLGLLQGRAAHCLGASGAVTAVMVLFAFHFPRHIILVFLVLPVPIWLFVVFQVAQDAFVFLGTFGGRVQTEVAVSVHLAGAGFAALYFRFHWRLTDFWGRLRDWKKQQSRPRLRVFHGEEEEPVPVAAQPSPDIDEHLEAQVDAVLEKVARTGKDSLTEKEKQILLKASEIYKRRRS